MRSHETQLGGMTDGGPVLHGLAENLLACRSQNVLIWEPE